METIIGIAILGVVGYTIYKMVSKKETVQEAVAEVKEEVTAKIIDVPKESAEILDKVQEVILAETKTVPSIPVQHGEHSVEPEPAPVKKVRAKRTKKVEPAPVPVVEEPVVVPEPEPVKKVRKKKVK